MELGELGAVLLEGFGFLVVGVLLGLEGFEMSGRGGDVVGECFVSSLWECGFFDGEVVDGRDRK